MKYIAFEGIEGTGKTFLLNRFIERYGTAKYYLIGEELDGFAESIFRAVIDKDGVFRGKHPISEMLCFFAIDLYNMENCICQAQGKTVLQDRGADTSCLYAAIGLFLQGRSGDIIGSYKGFFEARKQLGRVPDIAICLTGDFDRAIGRAEKRDGRAYSEEEKKFLKIADEQFKRLVEEFPESIKVLYISGKDIDNVLIEIKQIVDEC